MKKKEHKTHNIIPKKKYNVSFFSNNLKMNKKNMFVI